MAQEKDHHELPNDITEISFSNDPEVHNRRLKIARLRWVRRFTISQIVESLDVPLRTVQRDMAAVRKANAAARKAVGFKKDTATVQAELELAHADRQRERWQEYHSTKDAGLKRRLLNDIAADEEAHLKALQSLGVVDKAAESVNLVTETWPEKIARMRAERAAASKVPDPEE